MAVNIAILASGEGTNLQAIIDFNAQLGDQAVGAIRLVAANRASAGALDRARRGGIAAAEFDATDDGTALLALLDSHSIDLVALAGYLKRLPPRVIEAYHSRIINVHPGLLPEFGGEGMYGAKVHAAVIASGAKSTGVSVHFVDDEFDHGPLIAQWRLAVNEGETVDSLAERVLKIEHLVYPRVIEMVARLNSENFFADY